MACKTGTDIRLLAAQSQRFYLGVVELNRFLFADRYITIRPSLKSRQRLNSPRNKSPTRQIKQNDVTFFFFFFSRSTRVAIPPVLVQPAQHQRRVPIKQYMNIIINFSLWLKNLARPKTKYTRHGGHVFILLWYVLNFEHRYFLTLYLRFACQLVTS